MKNILLLGADTSIGKKIIDVIRCHKDELKLVGIGSDDTYFLNNILNEFNINYIYSLNKNSEFENEFSYISFFTGEEGLENITLQKDYDILINAIDDISGFKPTLYAIFNKKDVALANIDSLVSGGDLINKALNINNVKLLPLNNSCSNIYGLLDGHKQEEVKRIIISTDSINGKSIIDIGLDMMYIHHMCNIPFEKIDIACSENSDVKSLILFNDGSIVTSYNNDEYSIIKRTLLDFSFVDDKFVNCIDPYKNVSVNLKQIDYSKYPILKMIKTISAHGGNFGSLLNGAYNEAIELYKNNKIDNNEIENLIIKTLKQAHFVKDPSVEEILESDKWAREIVRNIWANNL